MLVLSVLRCPDAVPPETRRVTGGEFKIGRGADNDWIMPDPDRLLSKRHCVIAFRNGGWALADTSTNGTFINRDAEPLGAGRIRDLANGDRIRFGAYEIEARIEAEAFAPAPRGGGSPFDDPFGDDVFAARPAPQETFTSSAFGNDPLFGGPPPQQGVAMPSRFDPLAAPSDDDFFGPATVPDHTPSFGDAFRPPPLAPKVVPDDEWDLDLPLSPPAAAPPLAAPPAPAYAPPPPPAFAPPPPPLPIAPAPAAAVSPFAEEDDVSPPATPPERAAAGSVALLDAFLAGAGMTGRTPENPEATMRAMGAAMRATVAGIRQALIARSSIKGEFRIEQTMIRSRGNNPLKFSADDDDALSALIGVGRRMDVQPDAAIADALRDMRLHELATMAAMQDAVRALLAQLDPARLRTEAEGGGMTVLPAQKKARAFDAYEKLHGQVTRALADDFDSVFGKSFARAYEVALRAISAREPQ